jgi:hypothetical protein
VVPGTLTRGTVERPRPGKSCRLCCVSSVPSLQLCTVVARGDARNVFLILQKGGSGCEHLQTVCLDIIALCLEHRLDQRPEWLPWEENERADYLSKIRDVDNFGIYPDVFA